MKRIKKIAAMAMIVAVAVTAGWNFYQNMQEVEMNELALANVEALANEESGGLSITCYSSNNGSSFLCKCGSCTWGYTKTSSKGTCYFLDSFHKTVTLIFFFFVI